MSSIFGKILTWLVSRLFGGDAGNREDLINLGKVQNEEEHLKANLEAQRKETIAWQDRPSDDDSFAQRLRDAANADKSRPG